MRVCAMQDWRVFSRLVAGQDADGLAEVGILENDHRRVATELHRDALHVAASQSRQFLADGGRASEGDLADDRAGYEMARHHRRYTEDQVKDARRQASVGEGAGEKSRAGCRGLLCRLGDHRATGRQRDADLANQLVDREIRWRESRDGTDRLHDGHLQHAARAGGNDAAVGSHRLVGEIVYKFRCLGNLAPRLAERLAVLQRDELGDVARPLFENACRLAHEVGALDCRDLAPGTEALLRSGQGPIEISGLSMRDRADDFLSAGIQHVDGPTICAIAPDAVDEELDIGVRGHVALIRLPRAAGP
jgi:hypothetical protein